MRTGLIVATTVAALGAVSLAPLPAMSADTAQEFSAQKKKKPSARSSSPRPAVNAAGSASGRTNTGNASGGASAGSANTGMSGVSSGGEFSFTSPSTTPAPRR